MEFDYSALRGKICEKCGTLANFAKAIGISTTSLNERLQNKLPFRQSEIYRASIAFGMDIEDVVGLFFNQDVQKPAR